MGPVRTTLFLMLALLLPAVRAAAIDLRVTDSRGTEVTVAGLKVSKRDESVKPVRIEIEIVLRGGRRATAALLRLGAMKLLGRTELGDYSIDLDKVRAIAPVK